MSGSLVTEVVRLEDLSADPANARLHSEQNLDAIKGSLRRFGQQKPIVVDSDGIVRAGNGTLEAARSLGWEEIAIVRTSLEGAEAMAYAIADNRAGELATWDADVLAQCLAAIRDDESTEEGVEIEGTGFSPADIREMFGNNADVPGWEELNTPKDEEDAELPEVPDIPEEPITQPGDLWILGDHRLLCGDCASTQAVTTLLDGQQINVAISSPPYASQRKYDETSPFKPIHPDEYLEWFEPVQANIAQHLADDGSWFLNIKEHCDEGQRVLYVKDLTLAHVRRWGWRFVDEYIWTHGGTPKAVNQRFKNGWEPIFQFTRGRHKFRPDEVRHQTSNVPDWKGLHPNMEKIQGRGFLHGSLKAGVDPRGPQPAEYVARKLGYETRDGRKQEGSNADNQGLGLYNGGIPDDLRGGMAYPSNVLSLGKNREAVGHPAAYPTGLPTFFLKAYSDEGDIVFDPFLGSGTTLVAAEQLGRRCFGMEISPGYCDVIVQRWERLTERTAERV